MQIISNPDDTSLEGTEEVMIIEESEEEVTVENYDGTDFNPSQHTVLQMMNRAEHPS
jgi:hypothetical protein